MGANLSSSTAGVILRNLIAFSDQGADSFFATQRANRREVSTNSAVTIQRPAFFSRLEPG